MKCNIESGKCTPDDCFLCKSLFPDEYEKCTRKKEFHQSKINLIGTIDHEPCPFMQDGSVVCSNGVLMSSTKVQYICTCRKPSKIVDNDMSLLDLDKRRY